MSAEAFRSRIGSALSNRDFGEVEAAWREYASLYPDDWDYLIGVARQLSRHDKGALAGELCLSLSQALLDRDETDAALAVARASLRASQRTEGLRELLLLVYGKKYESNPNLDAFLDKTGLSGDSGGLRSQVDTLDRYLAFEEGAYVFHRGGWGYGVVAEFDADKESMVVDFQRKPGHGIGILNATKILERLPDDHIGVYKHYRTDELRRLIAEDPAAVFHIFLESTGRKATLKQVREELVPHPLGKQEWSKWWGRAKKALLRDPRIRIGKGSSPLLELREHAKPIEQEVAEKMAAQTDGVAKVAIAREYLRTLDLTEELARTVGDEVEKALASGELPDPARLALLYLKSDLKRPGAEEATEQAKGVVSGAPDLLELLGTLEVADRKRAVLDLIAAGGEHWPEQVIRLMRAGDAEIADAALEHLRRARPDLLIAFFSELSAQPRENPPMFLWYVRGLLHETIPVELAPGEKTSTVMEKLLTLADRIGLEQKRDSKAGHKEWLRQVRSFFTARRLKTFKGFCHGCSLTYGRYLYAKIQRNRGFTDQTKSALLEVIEDEHHNIHTAGEEVSEVQAAADAGDVIYTTLHGYRRRESELKQIIEVEVPKNAEDLGRAAAHGDISENAEYTAALEKQDQLMRRVRELRESLEKARILDPDEVTTELVVVGTQVRLTNLSGGGQETYALLGPWDTDLERGVISYLSPVGLGLIGKSRGATSEIELPDGRVTYRIEQIDVAPEKLLTADD